MVAKRNPIGNTKRKSKKNNELSKCNTIRGVITISSRAKKPTKTTRTKKHDCNDKSAKNLKKMGSYDPNKDTFLTYGEKCQLRGEEDALHFYIIKVLKTKYKKSIWDKKLARGSIDDISLSPYCMTCKRRVVNHTQMRRLGLLGMNPGYEDIPIDKAKGKYTRLLVEVKAPNGVISEEQKIRLTNQWKEGAYCAVVYDRESFDKLIHIYMKPSLHDQLITKWGKNDPCPIWKSERGTIKLYLKKNNN